jgi:hypothetical protein
MPQIRIAEIIDDFDVGRGEVVRGLKRLHGLRHLALTEIVQPALIGGARLLVCTGLHVPVQGERFDLALHGQDSLGVATPSIGHGREDQLPHRLFPGGQRGRPRHGRRGEGCARRLVLAALWPRWGFGRDGRLVRAGNGEVRTVIIILWPRNTDMGRDPHPLQHTVGRITWHRGGNGHLHMARNIFPLAPGTEMVGARAVHPFPNLDLLVGVRGI